MRYLKCYLVQLEPSLFLQDYLISLSAPLVLLVSDLFTTLFMLLKLSFNGKILKYFATVASKCLQMGSRFTELFSGHYCPLGDKKHPSIREITCDAGTFNDLTGVGFRLSSFVHL